MDVRYELVDGVRMATLLADDLDHLFAAAEDKFDVRAAEVAEARRIKGEEYLPSEMADRIVAGESPLRVWRQHRQHTLSLLGFHAGIQASYLSELELGKKPGTPQVWRKLANTLEVDVDDIMP